MRMLRKALPVSMILFIVVFAFVSTGCDVLGNNEFTVTFNLDGGDINDDPTNVTRTVNSGRTIADLPTPQKTDFNFGGWFTESNGAGTQFTTSTAVTSNITVYAKWTAVGETQSFTVTFNLDGGNIDGSTANVELTVDSGETIADLPTPQKSDFDFGGWFTEINGAGTQFTTSTAVTSNITVHAKWTAVGGNGDIPQEWRVTYRGSTDRSMTIHANSISFVNMGWVGTILHGDGTLDEISIEEGGTITMGEGGPVGGSYVYLLKDGQRFGTLTHIEGMGRFLNIGANEIPSFVNTVGSQGGAFNPQINTDGMPTDFAWGGSTLFRVTFDSNGGSYVPQESVIGATLAELPTPTKNNNTFAGWYTDNDTFLNAFTTSTPVTQDITLYAKWTAVGGTQSFTVTFNLDGGNIDGNTASVTSTVESGETVTSLPSPQKTSFDFGGWFTETNGAGTQFTTSTAVTSNITVYAKWTPVSFIVTYNLDGGNIGGSTANVQVTVNSGETATNLPSPQKTSFNFDGWFTEINGAGTQFTTSTAVTSNITVYAKWTPVAFIVTYNLDGGNIGGSTANVQTTVNSGETVINLPSPQKTSFNFGGWFTESNGAGTQFTTSTPVTQNITVYAKWTAVVEISEIPEEWRITYIGGSGTMSMTIHANSLSFVNMGWSGTILYGDGTLDEISIEEGGTITMGVGGLVGGNYVYLLKDGQRFGTLIYIEEMGRLLDIGVYEVLNTIDEVESQGGVFNPQIITDGMPTDFAWGGSTLFRVTFDSNGGSHVPQASVIGATLAELPTPTKNNNTFAGWYTDNNTFLNVFTTSTLVTQDVTVYAKWTPDAPPPEGFMGFTVNEIFADLIDMYSGESFNGTITYTHALTGTDGNPFDPAVVLLTEFGAGFSAVINSGELSLMLGTPSPSQLFDYSEVGIETENDVKFAIIGGVSDESFSYSVRWINMTDPTIGCLLLYADKDGSATGFMYSEEIQVNWTFKQGWNAVIASYHESDMTLVTAAPDPDVYKWIVFYPPEE